MIKERLIDLALELDTTWANALAQAARYAELNTPKRKAAFLAQIFHESAGLTKFTEDLRYSAKRLQLVWPNRFATPERANRYAYNPEKIANYVYADRMGNGSVESGDGFKFRGRTPIMLTGRANYAAVGKRLGKDFLTNPDDILLPENNMLVAADYWKANAFNLLADKWMITALSKKINGGSVGLQERIQYSNWALAAYEGVAQLQSKKQ